MSRRRALLPRRLAVAAAATAASPRRPPLPRRLAVAAAVIAALAVAFPSGATVVPDRTVRVSAAGGEAPNGDSANPAISSTGRLVAFDSSATNLGPADGNGSVRDVYTFDRDSGQRLLVSLGVGGAPADGPSSDPALSGPTRRVVFTSSATNLVPGDTNGRSDIFMREGEGPVQRVSLTWDGKQANGDSFGADVSDDGRFVVFTSNATNLVPGDTNGVDDVFVRDLKVGTTRRVSLAGKRGEANGRSGTASISPDGRYVSFESDATNLAGRDRNHVADVFVRDVSAGRTARVSVSSSGRQQNASVIAPFHQFSDVSRGGRYVVFDSDADNLVPGDTNRDTDVFLSDRRHRTTTRVSVNASGTEGDNDSFAPSISPDGRYVTFESFAQNLAPGDEAREDIFVHDRLRRGTVLVSVGQEGQARGPERVPQLLQQPALSNNGRVAAFISTADNLVPDDTNGVADVFMRLLTPPRGRVLRAPRYVGRAGGTVSFAADEPAANRAICRIDRGPQRECPLTGYALPGGLRPGRHVLRANVGGPGMLFDPHALRVTFRVDATGPVARITSPRSGSGPYRSIGRIRGTATDRGGSGVEEVEVAIVALVGRRRCEAYDGREFAAASCRSRTWVKASGRSAWRLSLREKPRGLVLVLARAVDRAGNRGRAARSATAVR